MGAGDGGGGGGMPVCGCRGPPLDARVSGGRFVLQGARMPSDAAPSDTFDMALGAQTRCFSGAALPPVLAAVNVCLLIFS